MKLLLRTSLIAALLATLAGVALAQDERPSLFDAGSRLSIEAHIDHVWFEGEGADFYPSDNRREVEGGLLLSWDLGDYLAANFSAMQGFESEVTTLRAGFSLLLLRP